MRSVSVGAVLLLAVGLAYVYFSSARRVESLTRRVGELEAQNRMLRDEARARVARPEAPAPRPRGDAALPRGDATAPRGRLLEDVMAKSAARSGPRRDPLEELREVATLSDAQDAAIRSILDDFARTRRQIFGQAQAEKRFIFDTTSLELIDQARSAALDRVRGVLSDAQYAKVVDAGLDARLGLRGAAPR